LVSTAADYGRFCQMLLNGGMLSGTSEASRFTALAQQAGESRIWAGIHYRSDVVAGFELARKVAEAAIQRARTDGSE